MMRPESATRTAAFLALLLSLSGAASAPSWSATAPWKKRARETDDWYRGSAGKRVAENIRSHQSALGSWPKNLDTTAEPFPGDRNQIKGTFDNGATVGELRFLARAYRATADERDRSAFLLGFDHILNAQYANGGWPQFYPPGPAYHRHITFNDGTMVNLLDFLRDAAHSGDFAFLDADRRQAAGRAFHTGVGCILRCQIKVGNALTVWCAQHDEKTLEPRKGRAYEHPSLSGGESAGILILLMSLDDPAPDVKRAIHSGARWYETALLTGIRLETVQGDKVVVPDPKAPPLWARFSEIGTNRPIFSGRDGIIQYDIARIEPERRNGYAWYGNWGDEVATRYARWKTKWGPDSGR